MKKCEYCEKEHDGNYGSGRFCKETCARGFSTKSKRKEINKKVSSTLKQKEKKGKFFICGECNKEFYKRVSKIKKSNHCSISCSAINKWKNGEYRKVVTTSMKKRCEDINERNRLRQIGRKGGFGKKGYTKGGVYYESSIEKECFEFLEEQNIKFIPHKHIPNSSKVSDVYLIKENLWVEIDGIDREKRKKWLLENYGYWIEKLKIYEREGLTLKIVKSFDEFKNIITP